MTSYKSLREEALSVERWNRLHPGEPTHGSLRHRVAVRLATGPIVAVTDFMRAGARPGGPLDAPPVHLPRHRRLRTVGHPRGPAPLLRGGRGPLVVAVLAGLAAEGTVPAATVAGAIERYGIDAELPDPWID